MELTQEQYNQAARYVDGEMDATERSAFEALLLHNSALREEVEAFREIRSLGESIDEKISGSGQQLAEKKKNHEAVWSILQEERKQWDKQHEKREEQDRPGGALKPLLPGERTPGKLKRIKILGWLAVAVVAGLTLLGVRWWSPSTEKGKPLESMEQHPTGSSKGEDSTKTDTRKDSLRSMPSSPQVNHPALIPLSRTELAQIRKKKLLITRQQLFRQHFVPDSLPVQLPEVLAAPAADYKAQRHKEAIAGYQKTLSTLEAAENTAPATRSMSQQKLARFYAHYYLGQSLLSVDHTKEAAGTLNTALAESPNTYWSSKTAWYLALAYLKMEQTERTNGLLKQVIRQDPSGVYAGKALQLSRKLKRD
ncbi:MAG: hypothetical protein INR73_00700 [Williamsia sp.]|nr:hypothetical protein [Williamsia sp.]